MSVKLRFMSSIPTSFPCFCLVRHNLNLAHSGGLDGRQYTDHTCLMGNPLFQDDVGAMCYNPAKNFQISQADAGNGWYTKPTDTPVWDSGIVGGTQWSGKLIGIADYDNNPNDNPVVLKIESGSLQDLFVGFNRAAGVNRDNKQADDKVTVVQAGADGVGYSQSFLLATLTQGESYIVSNWRGSHHDLTIKVADVKLDANPAYATVSVTFGEAATTNGPTEKPSSQPTMIPSRKPTQHPTNVSSERKLSPTTRPSQLTRNPTKNPTKIPTKVPTTNPTNVPSSSPVTSLPTQLPTSKCGDAVCGPAESSHTCPSDCVTKELETTFSFSLGSTGAMFDIKADSDVTVRSFDINAMSRGYGNVEIYTRQGSYQGHEQSRVGWTLVYNNTVEHNKRGEATELGELENKVQILANSTQGFYITSTRSLLYISGTSELQPFTRDDVLTVFEGVGTEGSFAGAIHSPRVWSGRIR